MYNKKNRCLENLSEVEYEAFLSLANNPNIIIQKADKGNTVVIVDKSVYTEKMEALLSDTTKFQKITFNPKHQANHEVRHMLSMEDEIKSCLKDLLDNNYLTEDEYKFLNPVGSQPGILYGMCKVHKDLDGLSPPFRPILAAIGTPTYNLSKFFVPLLKDHTVNEYTLNDSFTFAEDIVKQDPSLYMVSFDVASLFTNIPLNETIDLCVDKLYHGKKKVKGLLKRHCKKLLTLSTKSSCFMFNNVYYRQLDGVAMGSPLGPTLANLFLCHYETIWLNECPVQFKPTYYKRYVDDVMLLFKSKDHVKKFLKYLNSRHRNIQFEADEETNNSLAFLDVLITRDNGRFVTSVYRKKTFSGVYLNHNSYLPKEYKLGLLYTLLFRAYSLCSNYEILHNEIDRLKEIWLKNNYPLHIIDKCIFRFLDKLFSKPAREKDISAKKEVIVSLMYLGNISIQVKKRLRNIFRSCKLDVKLVVVFSSMNRMKSSFNFKDSIPRDLKSLVLYRYSCSTCRGTYLGETKRHFLVRSYEHLGMSITTNREFKFNEKSATSVRKHCVNNSHSNCIENFKIIGTANNKFHLKLKESLIIHKEKPDLNVAQESLPLKLFDN